MQILIQNAGAQSGHLTRELRRMVIEASCELTDGDGENACNECYNPFPWQINYLDQLFNM